MLTVALDAQHHRQSRAGIARYAEQLADALRKNEDVRVIELGGGHLEERGTAAKKLLTLRHDLLWYPYQARQHARSVRAHVYHSPLLRGPLRRGKPPFVMTVHDMVPVRWPETMPRWHRLYTRTVIRRLLDAADRIIVPSHHTEEELLNFHPRAQARVRVIPNGVDMQFFTRPSDSSGGETPFVLFVGTPEPRKNLTRLVAAVSLLRERGSDLRLVIVGGGGWGSHASLPSFVESRGRVNDTELQSLYARAACVALPSLHEGFGLPALEAMAAGAPVVATNSGALPEIAGDAAILIDPLSVDSIADGIALAIEQRDGLRTRGRLRAREFTWERAARMTLAVYRELV